MAVVARGSDAKEGIPTAAALSPFILRALERLGGEAALQEIHEEVASELKLTPEQLCLPHVEGKNRTEFDYRMAWARTGLRQQGKLERVGSGIWRLTGARS